MSDYAKGHVAGTTYQRYASIIGQHLVPALGHLKLGRLSPADLMRYYAEGQEVGRAYRASTGPIP